MIAARLHDDNRGNRAPGRSKLVEILNRRSGSIYKGMAARAAKQFINMPFTLAEFRDWLLMKFGPNGEARCEYSGEMILVENFTVDHRRPISRGGSFDLDNLALCSEKHNLRKGNMSKVEYQAFKDFLVIHLPPEVQDSIWKRLEIGDVQRFSYFRRQRKGK